MLQGHGDLLLDGPPTKADFDVMDYLKHGWHRDHIAALFRLSSRDVQAAIDYIATHREEVEAVSERMCNHPWPAVHRPQCHLAGNPSVLKTFRKKSNMGGAASMSGNAIVAD